MKTINVYTFDELPGDAQDVVIDHERGRREHLDYIPWADEIVDSLTAAIDAMDGVTLRDYSIDWCGGRSRIACSWSEPGAAELSGRRAWAWIENAWLGKFRIPWTGKRRAEVRKYGAGYRPEQVKPCPFTGVCFDDDYIDDVLAAIRDGYSVGNAVNRIAGIAERLISAGWDGWLDAEYIREDLANDDTLYTIAGQEITV